MKLKSYIKFFIGSLIAFGLQSCADDLHLKVDNSEEDFTGITLLIPDVESAAEFGATRTDGYANTRAYDKSLEGTFNTLYIAAVKKETTTPIVFLKAQSDGKEGEYDKYSIKLEPGYYKFYVVSNLNRYLIDESGNSITFSAAASDEETIRRLILNFRADRPLEPGFLPMACMNEDLKIKNNKEEAGTINGANYINISEGAKKYIYADLKYLCSKVRYTILFDHSKTEFNDGDYIDFHRHMAQEAPYVTNLRHQTAINIGNIFPGTPDLKFIPKSSDDDAPSASWPLFLDRYVYPSDFDFYANNNSDENIKNALENLQQWKEESDGSWTGSKFLKKRVWQGVTYLPENLLEDNPTLLKFPYSFNGSKGGDSPREIKLKDFNLKTSDVKEPGIRRSMMYDVYALVKKPEAADMVVNVLVEDWNLQNLVYQLHGPYELVVETTKLAELSMEKDQVFWFRTDIDPSQIEFISPKVSGSREEDNDMVDLYIGNVVKKSDGTFATNENGDYLFRIGLNPDIPYKVIDQLNNGGLEYKGINYTTKDISYFHLVAGSLNKYIEIENLNLDPFLIVDPQTIIIDTRELYTSGEDGATFPIHIEFSTNVDLTESDYATLQLSVPQALIAAGETDGEGDGSLRFVKGEIEEIFTLNGDSYIYKDVENKVNEIVLKIKNIIYGNPFWDKNHEYNLTFTLTLNRQGKELKIVKPVVIKVKPFSGTYVIHFRDNTKDWEEAHIYIFQDLTLPANMMAENESGEFVPYEHAGRIVGYIEQNPTSGFQWNAALQYVFTNNMSFRGWHGNHKGRFAEIKNGVRTYVSDGDDEYGGPSINDPWAEAHYNPIIPTGDETELTIDSPTYGFVMFGEPDERLADQTFNHNYKDKKFKFWNYNYSYNYTYMLAENMERTDRYNYDVNFNYDHQTSIEEHTGWQCWRCSDMAPDYNANDNRTFYPGIVMEKEDDGWWKYTLTGVAQPGRTVVIFANWHLPWDPENKWFDYRAEDFRFPGDYEAGLPLFDFEDNEGWFLFDGNTSNNDQQFTDEKPAASRIIPHSFTAAYSSLRIEVKNTNLSSIIIDGKTVNKSGTDSSRGVAYFDASGLNLTGKSNFNVEANGKTYKLEPKFFTSGANGFVTAQPLYTEFTDGIPLYVKWSDNIQPNDGYWKDFDYWDETAFYHPPTGGSNYMNVYWGKDETWAYPMDSYTFSGHAFGNYKGVDIITSTSKPTGSVKDMIELRLCTSPAGDGRFYKILKVEDLPGYYNPGGKKYIINWHLMKSPYSVPKPQ
ncbi:MAG: hypothetical protein J1D77_04125 [Muribaculaceae bacterium]|nr:hypothetical protein [Muribaculaceae bacterium]